MKKNLWIAAAGVVLLAGCRSEGMDQRQYTPAQAGENLTPMATAPAVSPAAKKPAAVRPAVPAFPPMTDVVSSGGVDSAAGAAKGSGEYVVRRGDSLGKIAAMHGVSLSALMDANNMTEKDARRLAIGKKLVIPAGGKAVAAKKSSGKATDKASVGTPKLNKDGFYEVQSGDSIAKIAARFHVKSSDILKLNNMTEADARRIQIGTKLAIPGKSAAKAAGENAGVAPQGKAISEVEVPSEGEIKTDVDDEDLSSDRMRVVEVEEDISLADFAAKYGVTADELRKYNIGCGDPLRKGDPILVPVKK